MWTLSQISPKTETIGVFETFAEVKVKVEKLADGHEVARSGRESSEAVYFVFSDDRQFEAYNHG